MAGWVHLHFQVVYILFVCVKCEELEELDLQILLARDCSKYVLILVRYNGAASKVSQSIFHTEVATLCCFLNMCSCQDTQNLSKRNETGKEQNNNRSSVKLKIQK